MGERGEQGEQGEQFFEEFMVVCTGREQDRPGMRVCKVRKKNRKRGKVMSITSERLKIAHDE